MRELVKDPYKVMIMVKGVSFVREFGNYEDARRYADAVYYKVPDWEPQVVTEPPLFIF